MVTTHEHGRPASKTSGLRLQGEQIYLRPVCLEDVCQRYCDWLNDPRVNAYLETRFAIQTIEAISSYVKAIIADPDNFLFAICTIESHSHVGNIKVGPVNRHHRHADISLFIGDSTKWGRGIATEAIRLAAIFAFDTLKLNKLKAGAYAGNTASIRAFERCGFRQEGRLQKHVVSDKAFMDVILLGRLAGDLAQDLARP